MTEPYWIDQDHVIYEASQDEKAELLREELVAKRVSCLLAMALGLGVEVIEGFVDDFWNPLREMALDPERVDVVLQVLIQGLREDEVAMSDRILKELEEL
jgi:hypothetical protein